MTAEERLKLEEKCLECLMAILDLMDDFRIDKSIEATLENHTNKEKYVLKVEINKL